LSSRVAYPDRNRTYDRVLYGRGPYLYTESGQCLLDAAGGSGSLILGHGDDEISDVLAKQAAKLSLFPSSDLGSELVETYTRRLIEFAPPGIGRATLYSSGSEALDAAIKLTIQYHYICGERRKTKIIGREGSFHGSTLAGLAAGGFTRRRKPYEAALPKVAKACSAHCFDCSLNLQPASCSVECADSLEEAIRSEGPETVAAFVVEPVVGATLSAAVPDSRYFKRVRSICDQYNVLFVADEVMTGFCRTGPHFAVEHWDIVPDVIVAGKAISAGYFPISAILVHQRIASVFEEVNQFFQNGHTHACSPLASAVGLHVLDRIERQELAARSATIGQALLTLLRTKLQTPWVADVRGLGLMIGVQLETGQRTERLHTGLSEKIQSLAMRRGLLLYPSSGSARSESGEHFLLLPPLIIDDSHVDIIVEAIVGVLRDLDDGAAAGPM
jgi:adenosylmethionine-8-amino-7-oxononanoate aminotransferase